MKKIFLIIESVVILLGVFAYVRTENGYKQYKEKHHVRAAILYVGSMAVIFLGSILLIHFLELFVNSSFHEQVCLLY